jgi:hypothetical protein
VSILLPSHIYQRWYNAFRNRCSADNYAPETHMIVAVCILRSLFELARDGMYDWE